MPMSNGSTEPSTAIYSLMLVISSRVMVYVWPSCPSSNGCFSIIANAVITFAMLAVGRSSSLSNERARSPSSTLPTAAWPIAGQASGTSLARGAGDGTVSAEGIAVGSDEGVANAVRGAPPGEGTVSAEGSAVGPGGGVANAVRGAPPGDGTVSAEGSAVSLTKEAIP